MCGCVIVHVTMFLQIGTVSRRFALWSDHKHHIVCQGKFVALCYHFPSKLTKKDRRTHFTQREDNYLVEYIARARPKPTGRQGNEIYKILVDNVGRALFFWFI